MSTDKKLNVIFKASPFNTRSSTADVLGKYGKNSFSLCSWKKLRFMTVNNLANVIQSESAEKRGGKKNKDSKT